MSSVTKDPGVSSNLHFSGSGINFPRPLYVEPVFMYQVVVLVTDERLQIDWQWPLSGVHSIMMVNSAQPGEGGKCAPTPFRSI